MAILICLILIIDGIIASTLLHHLVPFLQKEGSKTSSHSSGANSVDSGTASGHSGWAAIRGGGSGLPDGRAGSLVAAGRRHHRSGHGRRHGGAGALLVIVSVLLVQVAHGILSQGAGLLISADRVQLLTLVRDDGGGGRAADVEEGVEGLSDDGNVLLSDTERGGGETDLLDEVVVLGVVEVHELVNLVHGWGRGVGVEARHALLGAAQESTEEGVEMGEEKAAGSLVSSDQD